MKWLLILTVLVTSSSFAQINKCLIDGKLVYTDQECPVNTVQKHGLKQEWVTKASPSLNNSATDREIKARKDTYINGLRLLPAVTTAGKRLAQLGIQSGYVTRNENPGNGKYFCGALSLQKSNRAKKTIDAALLKIPRQVFEKLNLKYLVLCDRAESRGKKIGGIPIPPLNLLMLSVAGTDFNHLQHLVIHELYHFIEYRFNAFKDATWKKQFPKDYKNSYEGINNKTVTGRANLGFINDYARSFPHEDRAEIFASLLIKPGKLIGYANKNNDILLKEKIRYIKEKSRRLTGNNILK